METLGKILGGIFIGLFTALITIPLALVVLVPIAALDGWILHLAWSWFVVPTFGVAGIAWAMATGICLLVSWLVFHPGAARDEAGASAILVKGVGASLVSWFMMWGVHMWIIH